MKHFTLEQKYNIIKEIASGSTVGIHNYGMLHEIADALDYKNNTGINLDYISHRTTNIMRELIENGYPVEEYRIKCCSWTNKERWHPMFKFKE